MVRSFAVRLATLALTAVLAAALPLNAGAQGTASTGSSTQYHYSTSVTQVYGSHYPIAGHLDLEIFADGTLRGYYHNAFQKAFVPVVGGRDGNYIWFDIGPTIADLGLGIELAPGNKLHVVATVDSDNSFRGQIYPEAVAGPTNLPPANEIGQRADGSTGAVEMAGGPEVTGDQFIFAAKPVDKSAEDYQGTY
jgi:hypothetical protein